MNFIEVYPNEYPHYQLVGDEDDMFIFTEWLAEQMNKAIFDMLKTAPSTTSIWRGPEIRV